MKKILLSMLLLLATPAWGFDVEKPVSIPGLNGLKMGGFFPAQIGVDGSMGGKKPSVSIPKRWKFVGVSNGEKMNANNLWFQDVDGTIYLLHGFMSNGQFIIDDFVQKIIAK